VIQDQLPLALPCYDLVPVTDPTVAPHNKTWIFRYYRLPWLDGQKSSV